MEVKNSVINYFCNNFQVLLIFLPVFLVQISFDNMRSMPNFNCLEHVASFMMRMLLISFIIFSTNLLQINTFAIMTFENPRSHFMHVSVIKKYKFT